MKDVSKLLPTEGLLLLDIKGISGKQLLIKTVEELVLLGVIEIERKQIEGRKVIIVKERNFKNAFLKVYHSFFLLSVKEHYLAYKEITLENALTPQKLIGYVQFKLNFSDNRYKFEYIYKNLRFLNLVKSKFPYYYINRSLTEEGIQLRNKLKGLVDNLESEIKKGRRKNRFNELRSELGPNMILISGSFETLGKIKFEKSKDIEGPELEIQKSYIQWEIWEEVNLQTIDLDIVDSSDIDD